MVSYNPEKPGPFLALLPCALDGGQLHRGVARGRGLCALQPPSGAGKIAQIRDGAGLRENSLGGRTLRPTGRNSYATLREASLAGRPLP